MNSEKNNTINKLQVIKKRIVKVIIYCLLSLILLLSSITVLLQVPSVQTTIVQYLASYVSEKYIKLYAKQNNETIKVDKIIDHKTHMIKSKTIQIV